MALVTLLAACAFGCTRSRESIRERAEAEIRASLSIGDSAEKIERVLNEKHLMFEFDSFQSRYQARLDPRYWVHGDHVAVWIYVDQRKRLTKIATEIVLTGI